jgi:hypothetical protein
MQTREKQLLGVVVGMATLVGGYWLYDSMMGAYTRRTAQIQQLNSDLKKKDNAILLGRQATNKLADWEKTSLPSDFEKARSAYSAWLRKVVEDSGIENPNVSSQASKPVYVRSSSTARGVKPEVAFERVPTSVQGKATLDNLTKFLHEFYSAGHMHLIRSLTVTPDKDGKFAIKASIDALALPSADRTDTLTTVASAPLAGGKLEDYQGVIGKRNVFAAYKPEPEKKPDKPKPLDPEVDPARFTKVTGITDPGPVVWIKIETTGKQFKLKEGEEFDLGSDRKGKIHVIHVATRTVELQLDDERLLVGLGSTLKEGKVMGEKTAAK